MLTLLAVSVSGSAPATSGGDPLWSPQAAADSGAARPGCSRSDLQRVDAHV